MSATTDKPQPFRCRVGIAGSQVKAAIRDGHRMVPGVSLTMEDAAEPGDTVWVRILAAGTAKDKFFGPSGRRPKDITVFDVAQVVKGRIVEHWGVSDRFDLKARTGVLEGLAGPARNPVCAETVR